MKNLANCKPTEFFTQTVKIKKHVEDWLSLTKVLEIRKNIPKVDEDLSREEKNKILMDAVQENISKMFDAVFEENAEKTLGLLALLCFVEPEEVDNYPVKDYLKCFSELISCPEVLNFFISLAQLERLNTSSVAKQ